MEVPWRSKNFISISGPRRIPYEPQMVSPNSEIEELLVGPAWQGTCYLYTYWFCRSVVSGMGLVESACTKKMHVSILA